MNYQIRIKELEAIQDKAWKLIWDAENTSEGRFKYSLDEYFEAKSEYRIAQEEIDTIKEIEYPACYANVSYSNNA
jgi:hypothetical protein